MGYYSEVSFVTTPAGHELIQANKEKFGFEEIVVEYNTCGSMDIDHFQHERYDFFHYSWSFIKWFDWCEDVGSFMRFVRSEEFAEPYIFTRFGEDWEDTEREESGDTESLPYVDIHRWVEFNY